jgi:hypothetical protein
MGYSHNSHAFDRSGQGVQIKNEGCTADKALPHYRMNAGRLLHLNSMPKPFAFLALRATAGHLKIAPVNAVIKTNTAGHCNAQLEGPLFRNGNKFLLYF